MTDTTNPAPKSTGAIIGITAVALVVLVAISAIGGNLAALVMGPAANNETGPVAAQEEAENPGDAAASQPADAVVEQVAVAAVVNGQTITEQMVTDYIAEFRAASGLDTDEAWGEWMVTYGYTPETVRHDVVYGFVIDQLYEQAAEELNVEVTQEDIDAALADAKAVFQSEEEFQQALADAGISEDYYIQTEIVPYVLEEKVAEAAVGDKLETDENAFNEWLENYMKLKGVQINDMPQGLPYDIDITAYQATAGSDELDLGSEEMVLEDEDGNPIALEDLEVVAEDEGEAPAEEPAEE